MGNFLVLRVCCHFMEETEAIRTQDRKQDYFLLEGLGL